MYKLTFILISVSYVVIVIHSDELLEFAVTKRVHVYI